MDPGIKFRDDGTSIRPPEGAHSVTGSKSHGSFAMLRMTIHYSVIPELAGCVIINRTIKLSLYQGKPIIIRYS